MATRLARLTLFSGSQCSLCEVAKAELAKVKKLREFDLETINIQDKGQERWKRKYVYWIPALHLDGKEIAKGRWDASTVLQALKEREANSESDQSTNVALGQTNDSSDSQDLRLCFNCGSPDHSIASCPEPIDRQVVALSRQLFNFLHPGSVGQEVPRFYIAEGWKQQRLQWLEEFEPGEIRSPLLRDALGLEDGNPGSMVEWLRNMAHWGYPPGWFSCQNPKQLVRSRILVTAEVDGDDDATEPDPFAIFSGADDDEEIDLRMFNPERLFVRDRGASPTESSSTISMPSEDTAQQRWATYPNTYFSSTALSVYTGLPLGANAPSESAARVSATFTANRRALWERILYGGLSQQNPTSMPPWRLQGAFGVFGRTDGEAAAQEFVPPPPSSTPPPLPPIPDSPLNSSAAQKSSMSDMGLLHSFPSERITPADDSSVIDMDTSDDSE